jgi:sugar phosphate isomerase/epimerase
MRLSISNIAWNIEEDNSIAKLMNLFNIDAIDIVPGKYFPDPLSVSQKDVDLVKNWWNKKNIEIVGMQSLFFMTNNFNIFGTDDSRKKILNYLSAICGIAKSLGSKRLVFGSPKNRDCTGLNKEEVTSAAITFFRKLGDIASDNGVLICLEPSPKCYGTDFMNNNEETAEIVNQVSHASIQMQFDIGALTINKEDPYLILKDYAKIIGHVHLSEPNLVPLGEVNTNHAEIARAIKKYLPSHIVTIEMLATKNEPHKKSIERALCFASSFYKDLK